MQHKFPEEFFHTKNTETKEKVYDILYVGEDKSVIEALSSNDEINLINKINGYLAVSWLENNPQPYAIISEIVIPGMSGFLMHSEIYSNMTQQSLPFIMIDENYTLENKAEALKQNIDDIYNKPINSERLLFRLEFLHEFKLKKNIISYLEDRKSTFKIPIWKRTFDILFTSFAVLALSPIYLLTILLIRLESKGPIFYNATRVGAGLNIFPFHKFRSMYVGTDSATKMKELAALNQYTNESEQKEIDAGPVYDCPRCNKAEEPCSPILKDNKGKDICEYQYNNWKKKKEKNVFVKYANDPRITKVGKFIRKTSIDELPQLFNILKGDMSIVGNRPIPMYESELITSDAWGERFNAPAGLTGLWQVSKRGKAEMSEIGRAHV